MELTKRCLLILVLIGLVAVCRCPHGSKGKGLHFKGKSDDDDLLEECEETKCRPVRKHSTKDTSHGLYFKDEHFVLVKGKGKSDEATACADEHFVLVKGKGKSDEATACAEEKKMGWSPRLSCYGFNDPQVSDEASDREEEKRSGQRRSSRSLRGREEEKRSSRSLRGREEEKRSSRSLRGTKSSIASDQRPGSDEWPVFDERPVFDQRPANEDSWWSLLYWWE